MPNIEITEHSENNILILDINGRIVFGEGSVVLHRILREIVERGEKNLLLNFLNVNYIDSSGLGELVGGYITMKKIGGEIKLFNLTPNVLELMELTRLYKVFEIYTNRQEAINSFNSPNSQPAVFSPQNCL